jgi:serine/threonine protein kinase, bacterial
MPLSAGQTFAGYRIVRVLGSGGMGEVYLAEHPRLPRRDAIKVLPADVSADPDYRARFNREADLASKLWHPHIVSVHDRGEYNGQLWISMDYVDGLDAARLLANRYPAGMPTDHVVRIVTAVASALDYAHKQGLLHRDVKPANIMLTHLEDDADEQRILLADFGIARNVDDISGLTATNMTVGTVAYSAPEQLMGEEIDGRTDQYALAATAYHLLAGTPLFPLSNPAAVISRHLTSPPPALAATRSELAAFDPVLERALAKRPEDRFESCSAFAEAFHSVATSYEQPAIVQTMAAPVGRRNAAPPISTLSTGRSRGRRLVRWAIPIAVVALIAAGGAVVAYRHQGVRGAAPPAPPAAVLDGMYQLSYSWQLQTLNGAPAPPTTAPASPPDTHAIFPPQTPAPPPPPAPAPAPAPDSNSNTWWAFRSACTSAGCTATGTKLDFTNHSVADKSGGTVELHYIDGQWLSTPNRESQHYEQCAVDNGKRVPGSDTEAYVWTWRPQPDGSLRGVWTNTVLTNECYLQGSVKQAPVTVSRTGDAPGGVQIADPRAVPTPSAAAPPAPGPALDGTYRMDFDSANQKINGVITPADAPWQPDWWAFRSLCGATGCVATADEVDANNISVPTNVSDVLHFGNGQWQSAPNELLIPTCTVTRNGVTGPEQYPTNRYAKTWTPQPDGSLHGMWSLKVISNECEQQGRTVEVPFVATRVGPVPPAANIADPRLFIS